MKQFFAACALMLGIVSMSVAQEVVTGPSISLDKDVHDYGTIQQGANGACEFTVTNSGTEPLIISRCKGSCGCTVPQCEKSPIAPGNTSAITVKNDTKVIRIKGKVEASDLGNSGGIPVKQPAAGAPTTGKQ